MAVNLGDAAICLSFNEDRRQSIFLVNKFYIITLDHEANFAQNADCLSDFRDSRFFR